MSKQTFAAKLDLQKLEGATVVKGKDGTEFLAIPIVKAGLFKGEKGCYLDLVCFYDAESTDQFNNNGAIAKRKPKDSTDKTLYLGNLKNIGQRSQPTEQNGSVPVPSESVPPTPDDLPF